MNQGKFFISSLCIQNSSNHFFFSKSTVRNYLCPQGVVVGSKQISRQICTMSNSQINPQYYNITFKLGKGIKRSIHRKKKHPALTMKVSLKDAKM